MSMLRRSNLIGLSGIQRRPAMSADVKYLLRIEGVMQTAAASAA